jgi:hypothetical protein
MLPRALWGFVAHAGVDHGPRLRGEGDDRRGLAVFLAADTAMPRFRSEASTHPRPLAVIRHASRPVG